MLRPMTDPTRAADVVQLQVDGAQVELADEGITLLEALRDRLGVRSPRMVARPRGSPSAAPSWSMARRG